MATLETIGTSAMWLGLGVVGVIIAVGAIVGVFMAYQYVKKYKQYKIVIFEKDGFGQLKQTYDQGGVFVDRKTKNKRLFLKANNVGLNPDNIPYIQSTKSKTVYLFKTGLKNFRYIKLKISDVEFGIKVGEEDVNWSINAYERQKKLFANNFIEKILPFIVIAFVSLVILIIFIYFFRNFGVLAEVAASLKEAAQAMAQAKSGTLVLPA